MKKTILYILALLLLIAAVVLITKKEQQEETVSSDQNFAVEDIASVSRIFMADRGNNKLDLKKVGDEWIVNDRHTASMIKVKDFLETLKNLTVTYPVSKAQWNNVIKDLATTSTKVEIYHNGEDTPFKVYHVGGDAPNSQGTFMIMENNGEIAKRPYVINVPGHQGILSPRFFLNEVDWRDTEIFDYDPGNIKQVKLKYFQEPRKSFVIDVINTDSFSVEPLSGKEIDEQMIIYKPGVVKYLDNFSFLHAEAFVNDFPGKDSIITNEPFVEVSVTDQSGETKKMTVFYMPINRRSKLQYDPEGNELPYDLDRYYALINGSKDFVVIQQFVFGKIFRNYSDFFIKES